MNNTLIDKRKLKSMKLFEKENCQNEEIVEAYENAVDKRNAEIADFEMKCKRIVNESKSRIDKTVTRLSFIQKMSRLEFQERTIELPDSYNKPPMYSFIKTSQNVSHNDLRVRELPLITDISVNSQYNGKIADNVDSSLLQEIVAECATNDPLNVITEFSLAIPDINSNTILSNFEKTCKVTNEIPRLCRVCFLYGCSNHPFIAKPSKENLESKKQPVAFAEKKIMKRFLGNNKLPNEVTEQWLNQSCDHEGPCTSELNCICFEKYNFCESFCNCSSSECGNRFRGCDCQGECIVSCKCREYYRECVFGVCKCKIQLNTRRREVENNESRCKNSDSQMKRQKKLEVKPSSIPGIGWGVFAAEKIKKDDFVGDYTGELLTIAESDRRGAYYEKNDFPFQFTLTKDCVVDANRFGSVLKFVNNGMKEQNNNIKPTIMTVCGDKRICFHATKNIEIGSELFFNYNWDKKTEEKYFNKVKN